MSTVNVWDGTQWQLMDDKGPVGDQGPIGDKGLNNRISNCVTFTGRNSNVPDGGYEPPLSVVAGSQGIQPCMTISNTTKLKAVKAGVHVISITVEMGAVAVWDDNNWFIIERTVAVDGGTRIGSGDVPYGGFLAACETSVWFDAGAEIWFYFAKATNISADVLWTIRAVMMQ